VTRDRLWQRSVGGRVGVAAARQPTPRAAADAGTGALRRDESSITIELA